jgi:hypothetical protein
MITRLFLSAFHRENSDWSRFIPVLLLVILLGTVVANAANAMGSRVNSHDVREDAAIQSMRQCGKTLLANNANAAAWNSVLENHPSSILQAVVVDDKP